MQRGKCIICWSSYALALHCITLSSRSPSQLPPTPLCLQPGSSSSQVMTSLPSPTATLLRAAQSTARQTPELIPLPSALATFPSLPPLMRLIWNYGSRRLPCKSLLRPSSHRRASLPRVGAWTKTLPFTNCPTFYLSTLRFRYGGLPTCPKHRICPVDLIH
jgi:hypothetical protein